MHWGFLQLHAYAVTKFYVDFSHRNQGSATMHSHRLVEKKVYSVCLRDTEPHLTRCNASTGFQHWLIGLDVLLLLFVLEATQVKTEMAGMVTCHFRLYQLKGITFSSIIVHSFFHARRLISSSMN